MGRGGAGRGGAEMGGSGRHIEGPRLAQRCRRVLGQRLSRGLLSLRVQISQPPAQRRGGAGDEGSDHHRQRGEDRGRCARLARGIGCLACLRLVGLHLRDRVVNSLLCIGVRNSGSRRDQLCEIGAVRGGDIT